MSAANLLGHPESDVTPLWVGGHRVGISGLRAAIEQVKDLQGRPDPEIAQALFDRLKTKNYIPASAREEYQQAFLREFKKALGEAVAAEQTSPVIKILGPGCPNCHKLEHMVMELLTELNLPAEVEHIRDLGEITAHGVFSTPALIINNEVKTMGRVPGRELLRQWLAELSSGAAAAEKFKATRR
ncbi:MAG: thioredoxin family protein [Desulfobaccales bacterium]